MTLEPFIDRALEFPVAPSFTRIGYHVRRRVAGWVPIDQYDQSGQVAVVTGATAGLGLATARTLVRLGAQVVITGRDAGRLQAAATELVGRGTVRAHQADMADLDQVAKLADAIRSEHPRVDVLIHNAGALSATRQSAPSGLEATVAAQVVGPFALTGLLREALSHDHRRAGPGRVLTVTSGGMYTAGLTVDALQMPADRYRGAEQYARAKRAQVTLNEMWAERVDAHETVFQAMHPGWADTPGVRTSLPTFRMLTKPLLRTPDEGIDTLVWLAADDGEPRRTTGGFWHDRRRRPLHRVSRTANTDTPARRQQLWEWCVQASQAAGT